MLFRSLNIMFKKGFTFSELVEAGLVIQKDGKPNEGYDRFRDRLMFPIHNREGKVVGFGARLFTDEKDQPKYLNSPESSIFSKRKILYGLHENQRNIRLRGEAVVVEGYQRIRVKACRAVGVPRLFYGDLADHAGSTLCRFAKIGRAHV